MSLFHHLSARAEAGRPVRVGLIGAGKFGSMFAAQARRTTGLHLLGVADLSPDRAAAALARVGWPGKAYAAGGFAEALAIAALRAKRNERFQPGEGRRRIHDVLRSQAATPSRVSRRRAKKRAENSLKLRWSQTLVHDDGEKAEVGKGVDPGRYRARPSDIARPQANRKPPRFR